MAYFEDGEWVLMPGEVEPRLDEYEEVWFSEGVTIDDLAEIDEDVFDEICEEYEEGM